MTTTPDSATNAARTQAQAQARPDVEQHRQEAEQQARQRLDQDAVAAIEETRRALRAIADGKTDDAISAIERATGKIDVLLSRNAATALLPVDARVKVIDTAPLDLDAIREIGDYAEAAVDMSDYPLARVLLGSLISEIRVRTYHLPLATYPNALREAARMLDQRRTDEARALLQTALSTLVLIDRVTPLPLVLARSAISAAEGLRDQNKEAARGLLAVARNELERCMELGYMGKDEEYKHLNRTIRDLEKQLEGNDNTASAFTKLKDRMSSFFKRLTESDKYSQGGGGSGGGTSRSGTTSSPRTTGGAPPR